MTEEIKKPSEPLQPIMENQKSDKRARRALTLSSIFLVFTVIDSLFQYRTFGAWQILADAAGILIALIFLLVSLYLHYRSKNEQGNNLIPLAILFGYAPGDLFLDGVTIYNLVSGIILFTLAYLILKPKNIPHWLRMIVIYVAMILIFSVVNIFPRFQISQSPSWQLSLPIFTTVLTLLLSVLIIRSIQIKTIQTRMLIILISLGFIPTFVATASSTAIGFQRDLNDAERFVQTIGVLRNQQIETWITEMSQDIINFSDEEGFVDDINLLLSASLIESPQEQFLTDTRTSLQNQQVVSGKFREISVASLEGEIIASTNQAKEGNNIRTDQSFMFGKSELYNTPLFLNPETGLPEIHIYKPITDPDGLITAVILAELNTEPILEILKDPAQLGETGEAYLVNNENHLLTPLRNNPEIIPGENTTISSEAINETINNLGTRTLRGTNYLDQSIIGSYLWNPDLNAVLVIEQAENEAFQSLRLNLIINSAIGIITLVITMTIAVIAARNFSEPITSLAEKVSKVWHGELNQIEPIDRVDEIGELSQTLSLMTEKLIQTTTDLEKTVSERTFVLERRAKYLETTSQISRSLTSIYDLDDLLNSVTHLISENFGFYHVGVFLVDDQQEFAVLKASNSESGWKMLARNHKLRIGEQGIVGYVTKTGQPRIQQQVNGDNDLHFKNPDLPLTQSEMALPLKIENAIFGALDVQSTDEGAFSEEDVKVLQVLADSIAVAIQNTRLVQQLQENLETERKIYGDITREAWASLLKQGTVTQAFHSNNLGTQPISSPASDAGNKAFLQGKTILNGLDPEHDSFPIAVPVRIRGGVTVAVIETQKPASMGPWTKEEVMVLESVSDDLGIALENARLIEDTQRKAQRDRISAELASKIWASTDVENILQTAVRELGSALQVSRGTIQLTMPEESSTGKKPGGADRS